MREDDPENPLGTVSTSKLQIHVSIKNIMSKNVCLEKMTVDIIVVALAVGLIVHLIYYTQLKSSLLPLFQFSIHSMKTCS